MSRTTTRNKSLAVEEIDAERVAFRLTLEDKGRSAEGEELIHSLEIAGTLALPSLEILSIEPRAIHHPYVECAPSLGPVRAMVGTRIGPGFRARVVELMGRDKGCTHFMTLILDLAAAHTLTVFTRMRRQARYADRNAPDGNWMRVGLEVEPRLENACVALQTGSRVIDEARRQAASHPKPPGLMSST